MKYTSRSKGGRPSKPTDEKRDCVVTIKLTDAEYFDLKERAKSAGVKLSEFVRHGAFRLTIVSRLNDEVVERLKPKDVKAIRDLQGIAENLNRNAKFVSAIIKGGATDEQFIRTYQEMIACKNFVLSLIKIYRDTPDSL